MSGQYIYNIYTFIYKKKTQFESKNFPQTEDAKSINLHVSWMYKSI